MYDFQLPDTMSTDYHAKYFAFELTKRCASDSMEKLAASLGDAQVDLNPHQVEAALFAFRSPCQGSDPRRRSWGAQWQRGSTGVFPRDCN
jgi:hypothetical protein